MCPFPRGVTVTPALPRLVASPRRRGTPQQCPACQEVVGNKGCSAVLGCGLRAGGLLYCGATFSGGCWDSCTVSVKLMEGRRDEVRVVPSPSLQSCPKTMDEAVGQVLRLWALILLEGSSSHRKIGMLQSAPSISRMIHVILCFQTRNSGSFFSTS